MNLEEDERFIMCSAALFDSRINDNALDQIFHHGDSSFNRSDVP